MKSTRSDIYIDLLKILLERHGMSVIDLDGAVSVYDENCSILYQNNYSLKPDPGLDEPSHFETLQSALAFARSVILSGESWSDQCEKIIGDALAIRPEEES